TLQSALIALGIGLTVLLAALILAIVGASIPWAGTAVAIGLGVGAAAIGIALIVAGNNLAPLAGCRGALASQIIPVTAAIVNVTVIVLAVFSGGVWLLG